MLLCMGWVVRCFMNRWFAFGSLCSHRINVNLLVFLLGRVMKICSLESTVVNLIFIISVITDRLIVE